MADLPTLGAVLIALLLFLALLSVWKGVHVVPQSKRYTVERFGRYTRTLDAGLAIIVPFLDRIGHRVSILERQLEAFEISVFTRDNVEIVLVSTVFFRIHEPSKTMYRIVDVDKALNTTATAIVRSAAGEIDLDEMQSARDRMNVKISENLRKAADEWGIEITRAEIMDVKVDDETRDAQRRQLNAERERRAVVAKAEGDRRAVELAADAQLYEAQKAAEAVIITAEAEAAAVVKKAEADARQTELLARAIADNGQPAVEFEIRKRQVEAIVGLGAGESSKLVVVPAEVTETLGSIAALGGMLNAGRETKGAPGGGRGDA